MNKLEKSVVQGIRNSLNAVRNPEDGDDWEDYGNRMKTVIRANLDIIDGLLSVKEDDADKKHNEGLTLWVEKIG